MSSHGKNRVVLLVDMDCFYVQVVQRKNPELIGKPCAVVQYNAWKGGGIIAVGYEARKFGVTRQMRGDEAKEKCPDIHLVPVPENRGKADLTQFREAGAEVIEILSGFADCLERASVDEAYMDLTELINREFCNYDIEEVALNTFQNTNIVGIDNMATGLTNTQDILKCDLYKQWHKVLQCSEENLKLAIGAIIADKMRKEVKEKLGFTCSAGIGHNKMLAKIVAGFHKPDQQTLVLPDNVAEMFQSTKMRKIRSLGGKLGKQLAETFNVEYMSDLLKISSHDLEKVIGKKSGDLVYGLCRGIDYEPVRPRQLPKSVGCSKNFNGKLTLSTTADVYKWLRSLSEEVYERLEKEKVLNQRFASLITVGCVNIFKISQSRRCSQVKNTINDITDESFRALSEFNQSTNETDWYPPIINLHLTATKFQTMVSANKSIDTYMTHAFTGAVDDLIKINLPTVKPKNKLKSNISNFFSVADRSESNKPSSDEKQFLINNMKTPSVKLKDTKQSEYWNKFLTSRKSNEMILDKCSEEHIYSLNNGKQNGLTELNHDSTNTIHGLTEQKRGLSEPKLKSAEAILSSEKSKHGSTQLKYELKHSAKKSFFESAPNSFNLKNNLNDSFNASDLVNVDSITPAKIVNGRSTANSFTDHLFREQKSDFSNDVKSNLLHSDSITKSLSFFSKFCQSATDVQSEATHGQKEISSQKNDLSKNNIYSDSETYKNERKKTFDTSFQANKSLQVAKAESGITEENNSVSVDDIMVCEKCEKQVIAWNLPEHMDFHYAKEIQDSFRNNFLNLYKRKEFNEPPKKKLKQDIQNFFFV